MIQLIMKIILKITDIHKNMLFEHWIYSTAIAIIVGMIYYRFTCRDYSWLIIGCAYLPDLDLFTEIALNKLGITLLVFGRHISHGAFHNIAFMFFFAILISLLLQTTGIKFRDSFIFSCIGFGAHLFEDALVYNPAYNFLWPVSNQNFGIGIVEYTNDWYGIANTEVLVVGLIAVIFCGSIRTVYEGKGWVVRMIGVEYFVVQAKRVSGCVMRLSVE